MKAFRADLQQKSFNARKTNNYEDRINVTYRGMVGENSEEHYKELSENLEKSVSFLSGLLRAAEYQSINVGIQNALRGRSNNLYEEDTIFPKPPAPTDPATWPAAPASPAPASNPPTGGPPSNPSPGDTYTTPDGTTLVWENGRWRVVTYIPTTPKPAPAPAPQAPAQAPTTDPAPNQNPQPTAPRDPNRPPQNDPNDPFRKGEQWSDGRGNVYTWNPTRGWVITTRAPRVSPPQQYERNHPHRGQ